eukprot:2407773-Prymnesium_polylepis.3
MHGLILPSARCSAPTSVGSPSAVPVLWASTRHSSTPFAADSAARTRRTCAFPLGAVRLALLPSERTTQPPIRD